MNIGRHGLESLLLSAKYHALQVGKIKGQHRHLTQVILFLFGELINLLGQLTILMNLLAFFYPQS